VSPGCAHRLHLNNAGAALPAQPTLDAMTAHLRLEAEIGGYEAAAAAQDAIGDSYAGLAGLLGRRAGAFRSGVQLAHPFRGSAGPERPQPAAPRKTAGRETRLTARR
jgi:hypothetical protein